MASASYFQSSFLGGEFGPFAQGRFDRRDYQRGMTLCRNSLPIEEGSWTRRPGTKFSATTRGGGPAILREFHFSQASPYVMELSDGKVRFFSKGRLALENPRYHVSSLTHVSPAVFQTSDDTPWVTGDDVQFETVSGRFITPELAHILNRQFRVTRVSSHEFKLNDPVTGLPFDGTVLVDSSDPLVVSRVLTYDTPFVNAWDGARWQSVRVVQDENDALLLHGTTKPFNVTSLTRETDCAFATFGCAFVDFKDGPFMDQPAGTSPLVATGTTGEITLTKVVPDAFPWVATDVGRQVRIFSQPAPWNEGGTYAKNDPVEFASNFYAALKDLPEVGNPPDVSPDWVVAAGLALWTWGYITEVTAGDEIVVDIQGPDLLYDVATPDQDGVIREYRMGLWSDTTGWPTTGCYHEGRLVLTSEVIGNRIDASMSNDPYTFSPTGQDGTVADNNGISAKFQASEVNSIFWLKSTASGIVGGTQAGEWLVRATAEGNPLSPTNIQARRPTKYGCSNAEPVVVGDAVLFAHRFKRKLYEYLASQAAHEGYTATNLSIDAKHLSAPGVEELAYQQELAPVVWARMTDGSLAGCTYKRDAQDANESFAGWHSHELGSGRAVESIVGGPSIDGKADAIMLVTNDTATNVRWVEILTPLFDQDSPPGDAWFVDGGSVPIAGEVLTISMGVTGVRLWGYDYLEGKTVSVYGLGLDLGDHVVSSGHVTIPFDEVFTQAWLEEVSGTADFSTLFGVHFERNSTSTPAESDRTLILEYTPLSGESPGESALPDWDRTLLYTIGGTGDSIRQFNLETGVLLQQVSSAQLFTDVVIPGPYTPGITGPFALDSEGANIFLATGTSNQQALVKVSTTDLTYAGSFGTTAGGFGSNGTHWAAARNMVALQLGPEHPVVVSTSLNGNIIGGAEVAAIDMREFAFVDAFVCTENAARICAGETVGIGCWTATSALVLGCPLPSAPANADPLGLYVVNLSGDVGADVTMTHVRVGQVVPSDIDPLWTEFAAGGVVGGIAFDHDDNTVICDIAGGGIGAAATYYLVKLSIEDASVIWTSPVAANPGGSRIVNGRFSFLSPVLDSGAYPWWDLDTTDGTSNNPDDVVGVANDSSLWDGLTGRWIGHANYTKSGPSPQPIAPTPDTFSNQWCTFPPAGSGSHTSDFFAPFVAGMGYTTRGQILRPIDPQKTGAVTGPAFAKTRRTHQFAALLHSSGPISFGTVFGKLRPAIFQTAGGRPWSKYELFSGTYWSTLEDDYSFDSMIGWEVTRPVPATVLSIGAFIQTQDR